jgi:hypothetical protein
MALDMHQYARLLAAAAQAAKTDMPTFQAASRSFVVATFDTSSLAAGIKDGWADVNDRKALSDGFTQLTTLLTVCTGDSKPYAICELYSVDGDKPFREKGVETDINHQRQGIMSAFLKYIMTTAPFELSGMQTPAGEALLARLRASGII